MESSELNKVWTKLFEYKVYVVVYIDPYTHSECQTDCCGVMSKRIMGVASSKEEAEELIKRYQKRVFYNREDFDVDEYKLDGEFE